MNRLLLALAFFLLCLIQPYAQEFPTGPYRPPPGSGGTGTGTGDITGASNIGTGGLGLYHSESAGTLRFKNLSVGDNLVATDDVANNKINITLGPNVSILSSSIGIAELDPNDCANGQSPQKVAGAWACATISGGAGSITGASNTGTAGVGVFRQVNGAILEFKKINIGTYLSVADDTGNGEVDLDLNFDPFTEAEATTHLADTSTHGITSAIAGINETQTLTNKTLGNTNTITLKDTLLTLQDETDTTKQAQFDLSGLTTATTRTYGLPNFNTNLLGASDINVAGGVCGFDGTAATCALPTTHGHQVGTTAPTDPCATAGAVYSQVVAGVTTETFMCPAAGGNWDSNFEKGDAISVVKDDNEQHTASGADNLDFNGAFELSSAGNDATIDLKPSNLATELTSGQVDGAADFLIIEDATDGVAKKVKPSNLGIGGAAVTTSVPMRLTSVNVNSSNAYVDTVDGTNFDYSVVRFTDNVTGTGFYSVRIPNNLATAPTWNLVLTHKAISGTGGNVSLFVECIDVATGSALDVEPTNLFGTSVDPDEKAVNTSANLTVTALSATNLDSTEALTAGSFLNCTVQRQGADANDTLSADWFLLDLSLQINVN